MVEAFSLTGTQREPLRGLLSGVSPTMKWSPVHKFVAFLLATNYFTFQVELFEEEYEANHRRVSETCSIASPTLTWESFDKENAPKAFVFDAGIRIQFLFLFESDVVTLLLPHTPFQPIRDKSPPFGLEL